MIFDTYKSIDFATDVCYVWRLEKDHSGMNIPLPLIAAYVHGSYADKVDFVDFRAYYGSTSSVSIDLKVVTGVGYGTNLDYEIIGTTMTLTGDNPWLNEDRTYRNNLDFVPPVMLCIGFLGDVALARYRLYRYGAGSLRTHLNIIRIIGVGAKRFRARDPF